jgi:hypothetical protein
MWFRMFFSVAGPGLSFETRGPLLVPALGSIAFAGLGLYAVVMYGRRVFRKYMANALRFLAIITVTYVAILWLDNFRAYLRTGQPVAINGRYLFPVLLPVLLFTALSVNEFCRRRPAWLKPALAGTAVVCMLWGGGALTYVLRSRDAWYWPNQPAVNHINDSTRRVLGPVVPGYRDKTEFMGRHGT